MANNDFAAQIAAWAAKTTRFMDETVRGTAYELGSRIIDRTPEDTGLARGNWMCGIGSPDTSITTAKGARAAKARLAETLKHCRAGDRVFISNALPYVPGLEYGTNTNGPHAMVRKTAAEFSSIVREAAAKAAR